MNLKVVKAAARPTGARQEMLLSGLTDLATGRTKKLHPAVGAILRRGHRGTKRKIGNAAHHHFDCTLQKFIRANYASRNVGCLVVSE